MTQADILRKYRRYNPDTAGFDMEPRLLREYAQLLQIDPGHLSRILSGVVPPGLTVLERLVRAFPASADDIAAALKTQPESAVA